MSSTPNLETFDAARFAKEIRAFMKKHTLSVRDWAELTKSSPSNLRRLERDGRKTLVETIAKYQRVMRTYRSGASRVSKRSAR